MYQYLEPSRFVTAILKVSCVFAVDASTIQPNPTQGNTYGSKSMLPFLQWLLLGTLLFELAADVVEIGWTAFGGD
jgi:hypothetical protein